MTIRFDIEGLIEESKKEKEQSKKRVLLEKNQSTSKQYLIKTTEIENIIKDKNEEISQVPSISFFGPI